MAVSEDSNRMYQRLEEMLGSEEGSTLMELLPSVEWADVTELHHGLAELHRDARIQIFATLGGMAGLLTLFSAAGNLL